MTPEQFKAEHEQICEAVGNLFGSMHRVSLAGKDEEVLNFATGVLVTFRQFCDNCDYNFSVALKASKERYAELTAEQFNSRN